MRAHRSMRSTLAVVGLAFLALLGTGTHTVRRGETLAGIAVRNGTTVAALVAANHLADPDVIRVGQELAMPSSGGGATSTSYTVRAGDTLASIAAHHGSTIARLASANHLHSPYVIRIGQVLSVPSGGRGGGGPSVTTPAGGATTYVVRAGDTVSAVAGRFRISQAQLIAANGITDGRIYIGQRLQLIPTTGTGRVTASTYVVRAGDTLSRIADRFGTTVSALVERNSITNPNQVMVARTLQIPAGGGVGGSAMACPVGGRVTFMNDWGFPRSGGRFHEGNDLFAARGTPAVAAVSGTVVRVVGSLGGNQVKLLGDDGTRYSYSHLDRFGANGRVTAGDVVGYVGTTGNAAGGPPHVHFEVHPGGGAAVNPYPRLVAACR